MNSEETKERYLKEDEGQPADVASSNPKVSTESVKLHCPQCGSSHIRKRSRYLLISVAVFAGLFVLARAIPIVMIPVWSGFDMLQSIPWLSSTFMFLSSVFAILLLISIAILVIWPTLICATACIALVGRHRCKNCGHRFYAGHGTEQKAGEARFPVSYSVFSALILFLGFVVGPLVSMRVSGGIYAPADLRIIMLVVAWSLAAGLCVLFQAVVYRLLSTRIRSSLMWAVLFLLPALVLSSEGVHHSLPRVRAQKILAEGGFAPLPRSATQLRVYGWWFPDEVGRCMMFRATAQDVEEFLNASPTLKGRKCKKFSPESMRMLFPRDTTKWMEYIEAGHELIGPLSGPPWYKEEIKGYGRYYSVPTKDYRGSGQVIVDDEENIVYVKVIWS